jgi:hypothetical protein
MTAAINLGVFSIRAQYFWYYDFNYDSRLTWADDECNDAADFMDGEYYDENEIQAYVWDDPSELFITAASLGKAKLFHQASHGGHDGGLCDVNYLITHDDDRIYPDEIPDLSDVHGGGDELLGFGSACYSGTDGFWPRLWKAFINEGSVVYMGYSDSVDDVDAYDFAVCFYEYLSEHYTIEDAIEEALDDTDYEVEDILVLKGDGDIYVVDD